MTFLNKHKWTILYWIIFVSIVLYFVPRQSEYYLDKDIKSFKTNYLHPFLIWTGCIICAGLLLFWIIKTKSIKSSLTAFLTTTLSVAFFLFIFQNVFLGAALFLNRQFKQDSIQKSYVATYLAGTDQTKENFFLYDLTEKQISLDKKLINRLYKVGLKQSDTIALRFDKGLFGIAFQIQRFGNK